MLILYLARYFDLSALLRLQSTTRIIAHSEDSTFQNLVIDNLFLCLFIFFWLTFSFNPIHYQTKPNINSEWPTLGTRLRLRLRLTGLRRSHSLTPPPCIRHHTSLQPGSLPGPHRFIGYSSDPSTES